MKQQKKFHIICFVMSSLFALTTASLAQTTGNESARPLWPDNGIAQRMLPGAYNMFVEQDGHGQWHAWVMNGDGEDAEAIDFFSGKKMHVKAGIDEDSQQQTRDFVDPTGGVHGPESRRFTFAHGNVGGLPGGIVFGGGLLSLDGAKCSVAFVGVEGGVGEDDPSGDDAKWNRIPIYRDAPEPASCTSGRLSGGVNTTLDLEDGTFLATEGCWIFRLRKSDLSPVGLAPALRIVDKSALQTVIDQAKGKNISDASTYLAKALNLSFDTANTCKKN